jgi:hypothetical protein
MFKSLKKLDWDNDVVENYDEDLLNYKMNE